MQTQSNGFVGAKAREQALRAAMMRAGKNRTRGKGRPVTSEPVYTLDHMEFFAAIQDWQNRTGRRFPDLSEVLSIAESIGYRKPTESNPLDAPI